VTSGSGQRVEATQERPVTGNGHSGSEDSNLPGCDTLSLGPDVSKDLGAFSFKD
jgi:hypothetical protein